MTLYSSRKPFNDDPHPNVWSGHTERNQMRTDTDTFRKGAPSYLNYEGNYVVRPRPEYDRPQHNPTNPILVAAREDIVTWVDTQAAYEWWAGDFDLAPEIPEQRHPGHVDHARKVLIRLAALKGGIMNEKRYKVVQDARGYWGIWDREADDFASWGYPGESGAEYVYSIIVTSSMLNSGQMAKENFDWDGEYLPRENA